MERKGIGRLWHAACPWLIAALVCGPLHVPIWQGLALALVLPATSTATVTTAAAWCVLCATAGTVWKSMTAQETACLTGMAFLAVVQLARGRLANPRLVWACVSGGNVWVRPVLNVAGMVLTASLAIRGIPPTASVSLALLCFIVAWALPSSASRVGYRLAGSATLLVTATLVSLLAAEYAARILLGPRPARQIHVHNPEYLFTLRPNAVAAQRIPLGPNKSKLVGIHISSQGFRDREYGTKAPDEFRILLLGDSFAMGFAVEEKDSIARQLEALLQKKLLPKRVSVINGGMTGAGPWQEWGILRDRGLALRPDLVVLQLCTVNDIDNSLEYVGKRQRAYYRNWHVLLETLRNLEHPAVWAEYTAQCHSRLYREIWFQSGLHPWVSHGVNALRWIPRYTRPEVPPGENRPNEIESDLAEWYPDLYQGLELCEWFVVQIRDLCHANGIPFAAFSIPPHPVIDDSAWQCITRPFGPRMYERGKGLRIFDEILRRNDIPTFSVVPALKSRARIEDVYYVWDGHLTALGNGLVAQTIRDYVIASCFPSAR